MSAAAVAASDEALPAAEAGAAAEVRYATSDGVTGLRRLLAPLPQRSRLAVLPWWERPDPYWAGPVFETRLPWSAQPPMPPRFSGGAAGDAATPAEAALTMAAGWLHCCGMASEAQLDAIAGTVGTAAALVRAGLAEQTAFHPHGRPYPRLAAVRASYSEAWLDFAGGLLASERYRLTFLGCDHRSELVGRHHARHQMLTAELLLRAREASGDWVWMLPEMPCVPARFCPPGHPGRERYTDRIRADGALVRGDGAVVFVEIEAGGGFGSARFIDKVRIWSDLLTAAPLGAVVLFVAAAAAERSSSAFNALKAALLKAATKTALPSMLAAAWLDYCPDHGVCSETLPRLEAVRYDRGGWEHVEAASVEVEIPAERSGLLAAASEAPAPLPPAD